MPVIINDFDVRSEPQPNAPAVAAAPPPPTAAAAPPALDRQLEKLAVRRERLRAH